MVLENRVFATQNYIIVQIIIVHAVSVVAIMEIKKEMIFAEFLSSSACLAIIFYNVDLSLQYVSDQITIE